MIIFTNDLVYISRDLGLPFAPEGSSDTDPIESVTTSGRANPTPRAAGLLLELITLSGETEYCGHVVSKKGSFHHKVIIREGRLLPFITCGR